MFAPVKPDYSNVKFFNSGKKGDSAKICKQPKQADADRRGQKLFPLLPTGAFRRNCPMHASKSGDGADPRPSTSGCKKIEYTKTRKAYIELVIAGRTCSCLLDSESDVTLFPHAVRGFPLDQCIVDLSAANGTSIPILGAVTVTARLQGRDIEIEGLVTDHVDEVILDLTGCRQREQIGMSEQEN